MKGFIEALLALAKKRCTSSETLVESFQRLVSSCHSALEDDRRRLAASQPRLAARRRFVTPPSTFRARLSAADVAADVAAAGSARQPAAAGRTWPAQRSASSGALRRLDYRQFSPDINGAAPPRRRAFAADKSDRATADTKTEH